MSSSAESSSQLLDIPLEIRHQIFSHVAAARNVKPRHTLRYWFEKVDIQEQIEEYLEKDPDANITYVAGYSRQQDSEDDEPEADDSAVVDDETGGDNAE